jgi:sugar-specific transcriptional regulator TrmB
MGEPIAVDRLASSLTRFGLSDREAVLYLASLRRGRATARELTRDAQIDRVLGYRLLDAMRARGVMEITAERPRRYAPIPPAAFLERHLRGRRDSLASDEEFARELSVQLAAAAVATSDAAARYQVLSGPSNIYDYLGEMTERAREKIEVMLTFRSMRDSLDHDFGRKLGPFMARGGTFRLILESDPRLPPTLARFQRSIRRFPSVEIREMGPQPSRLTIVDGREALLFLVPESTDRGSDQVAVWTDHPGFVQGQRSYFHRAWLSAVRALPSRSASPPMSRGRGRPSVRPRDLSARSRN